MSPSFKRLFGPILALALVLSFVVVAAPAGAASKERSYLLIANTTLPARLADQVRAAGGTVTRATPAIGVAVATSSKASFAKDVSRIGGLRAVVPDIKAQWINKQTDRTVVVDATYGNPPSSGLADALFDLQWGHAAIDAPAAWNAGYFGAGVRVAVLDDGIDSDHPDLAPNLNTDLSASFVPGEPFEYTENDPFSHGTHVAGTIGAALNGIGTVGVAPEVELVMVKVLSSATGSGSWESVASGIVYAADIDSDVINMSLGASLPRRGYCDNSGVCVGANEVAELANLIGRATNYAYQKGSTIITSLGNAANDGNKDKDLLILPAHAPHVISISATAPIGWAVDPENTFLNNLASYSNFGTADVDFAAPGGDFVYPGEEACTVAGLTRPCWVFDFVFSTGSQAAYYWSVGTSMAAPHAAGVAALVIGKNGGSMHPAQVESALRKGAVDLGKPGRDAIYGHGLVNAYNSVMAR